LLLPALLLFLSVTPRGTEVGGVSRGKGGAGEALELEAGDRLEDEEVFLLRLGVALDGLEAEEGPGTLLKNPKRVFCLFELLVLLDGMLLFFGGIFFSEVEIVVKTSEMGGGGERKE